MKHILFLMLLLGLIFNVHAEENEPNLDAELGLEDDSDDIDELDNMEVEFAQAPGIRSRVVGDAWMLSASFGLSYTFHDFKEVDNEITQYGFPIIVDVGHRFNKAFELSAAGMTSFSVGLNTGFIQVASGTVPQAKSSKEFTAFTVPITIYGKMHFKYINFQLGVGGHIWNVWNKTLIVEQPDKVNNKSGFTSAITYAFSHNYEIRRGLEAEFGLRMYYIPFTSDTGSDHFNSYDYPVYMVTAGLTYLL